MKQKYMGSCHCGGVKYEVDIDISNPIECNCSICNRLGYVLAFVGEDDFNLLSGEENLKDYTFNTKKIHHLFCETCGVHAYGWGTDQDGNKMISVNLRCLDGVNILDLETNFYDGASM